MVVVIDNYAIFYIKCALFDLKIINAKKMTIDKQKCVYYNTKKSKKSNQFEDLYEKK